MTVMENQALQQVTQEPYFAQIAVTSQQALESFQALQTITQQVLRKGIDYGIIEGTEKPTLFKAGAENLLRFYGLGHRVQLVEQIKDWENGFFYYSYKVSVVKTLPNGTEIILGECEGSANNKEKRYRKHDPYSVVNTLQKMAIKRALVGATLQATGASGIFTQDMEDLDFDFNEPAEQPERKTEEPQQTVKLASERQRKCIFTVGSKKGLTEGELKALMYHFTGKTSSKELTAKEASNFIDTLNQHDRATLLQFIQVEKSA